MDNTVCFFIQRLTWYHSGVSFIYIVYTCILPLSTGYTGKIWTCVLRMNRTTHEKRPFLFMRFTACYIVPLRTCAIHMKMMFAGIIPIISPYLLTLRHTFSVIPYNETAHSLLTCLWLYYTNQVPRQHWHSSEMFVKVL